MFWSVITVSLTPAPALWDHTTQNLLQICLAFLVLVALVCILAEDWLRSKKTQEGANLALSWECRRSFRKEKHLDE